MLEYILDNVTSVLTTFQEMSKIMSLLEGKMAVKDNATQVTQRSPVNFADILKEELSELQKVS